jgi:hypothetical protein
MKNIHIPDGEKGSQNDLTKRALNDPDFTAMELFGKPKVCINVISNLEQYAGADIALSFAKKVISLIEEK